MLAKSYHFQSKTAKDLLMYNEIADFLEADDFVFMMHQGYTFGFFKANGYPNPVVFGFQEGTGSPI